MKDDPAAPRRILHLTLEGLSSERLEELRKNAAQPGNAQVEIMALTEANSRQALEKIFAADTVAVWGELVQNG